MRYEVVEGVSERLPEGTVSPGPYYTLCASLTSIAGTIAQARKWAPTAARVRMDRDLIRMVSVSKYADPLLGGQAADDTELALFLHRDASIPVPPESIDTIVKLSRAAADAQIALIRAMIPFVPQPA